MKKTYAEVAEMLAKKKGKYEKMLNSGDQLAKNTAERMLQRIDSHLDQLFADQEASKPQMGNGGKIKKYSPGGPISGYTPLVTKNPVKTAPADINEWTGPYQYAWDQSPNLDPLLNPLKYFGVADRPKNDPYQMKYDVLKPKDFGPFGAIDEKTTTTPAPVQTGGMTAPQAVASASGFSRGGGKAKPKVTPAVTPPTPARTPMAALPSIDTIQAKPLPTSDFTKLGKEPLAPFTAPRSSSSGLNVNTDNLLRAASFALPFAEVGAGRRAIDRMAPPPAPVLEDPLQMNTTYNINPQLIEARRAQATLNNAANQNVSGSAANALRAVGFATRLGNAGQAYAMKENAENQMRNQLAGANAQIAGRNVGRVNQFNNMTNRFRNDREAAIYENNKALFDRLQTAVTDMRLESRDKKVLQLMAKQYDPGIVRRALGDTGYENLLKMLAGAGDSESQRLLEQFKNAK